MNVTAMLLLDEVRGLFPNQYVWAFTLFAVLFVLTRALYFLFEKGFLAISKRTKTTLDDKLFEGIRSAVSFFLLVIAAKIAFLTLTTFNGITDIIDHIINSLIIISVTWGFIKTFSVLIDHWGKMWARKTKSKLDDSLISLFHRFSNVAISIFGALLVLSEWDIDVTGFLAGLGIAGIAIGFALQDSLSNIFGGISLILDKAIKVGDFVQLDSGETGEVTDVGLRSTRIRTWDNELMIIPNGSLANAKITNWKLPDLKARVKVDFGVQYGSKPDKVQKIVKDLLKKDKDVLKDPEPAIWFQAMGESSLNFTATFWVENVADRFAKQLEYTEKIYNALNKNKIGIPFPTRTVYMHNVKK